jgi:endonuclease/exonuclease/phosphatase family metal-dependent hydrolase
MKNIILILAFTALVSCVGEDQKGSVRTMTFNIRYDNPDDGENRWENRRDIAVRTIVEESPDLLGMQEVLHHQLVQLDTLLPWYDYVGVGRDDGKTGGEYVPIFYKMNRLELKKWGTFWLSEDPDSIGSVGWDAALPRITTWAKFWDMHTQKYFYALNTHFDHRGLDAKDRSIDLIEDFIEKNCEGLPVVVTGDLNFKPLTKEYNYLTREGAPLLDSYILSVLDPTGPEATFNAFQFKEGRSRIDYILVTGEWKVYEYETLNVIKDGVYISDHYPVVANIKLTPLR